MTDEPIYLVNYLGRMRVICGDIQDARYFLDHDYRIVTQERYNAMYEDLAMLEEALDSLWAWINDDD